MLNLNVRFRRAADWNRESGLLSSDSSGCLFSFKLQWYAGNTGSNPKTKTMIRTVVLAISAWVIAHDRKDPKAPLPSPSFLTWFVCWFFQVHKWSFCFQKTILFQGFLSWHESICVSFCVSSCVFSFARQHAHLERFGACAGKVLSRKLLPDDSW